MASVLAAALRVDWQALMPLTAEEVVQRAESLTEGSDVFGGAEPAGHHVGEEIVVFTHRLQERSAVSEGQVQLHQVSTAPLISSLLWPVTIFL